MKTWKKAVLVLFVMSFASLTYSSVLMHLEYIELKRDKKRHDKAFLGMAIAHTSCIETIEITQKTNENLSVSLLNTSSKLNEVREVLERLTSKINLLIDINDDLKREKEDLLASYEALHEELVRKNKQLEARKGQ